MNWLSLSQETLSGEVKTYPVVEMEFHPEANQVEYVICPARITNDIANKAREVALKVAEIFGSCWLIGGGIISNSRRVIF